MNNENSGGLDAVGSRLRNLRHERETTLAELSAATGISVSTLSRLEPGSRRPTLEQLLPLARAHGVTLDELVDTPATGDPRVHLCPIHRKGGQTVLPLTRRHPGLQVHPSRKPRLGSAHSQDPRGVRVGLRPQRAATARAR